MTNATFYKHKGKYWGFRIDGHNNYARAGYNIVCAAISALSQAVVLALNEVLNVKASVMDSDGLLDVRWDPISPENDVAVETLAKMLHASLDLIKEQYTGHLSVEVKGE